MKQSKDPFEAAYEEQEESPPESPIGHEEFETQTAAAVASSSQDTGFVAQEDDENFVRGSGLSASTSMYTTPSASIMGRKNKVDDEEEEEDNMEVELSKFSSSSDPVKVVKMQAILKQLTGEQMSRYESFRRSALQKSNMRRLLVSICGTQKISLPMTIVVCGIAKMFVGELIETARMVMTERKDSGPIRPCHIRESYRRLKLEGKIPKRSVPRLFR